MGHDEMIQKVEFAGPVRTAISGNMGSEVQRLRRQEEAMVTMHDISGVKSGPTIERELEITREDTALAAPTPMTLLQMGVARGLSVEQMAQLLELHLRWEANEAKKAYTKAMNAFKKNPPAILKNKHVKAGQMEYDHATLDHVCEQITQGLGAHGISHRWDVDQKEGRIAVICILTHDMGHSERTRLEGAPDTGPGRNAMQSLASAVTYLERYTLLAATGLAAKNGDNDGAGSPEMKELKERLEWIANCRTLEELDKIFQDAYKIASGLKAKDAMNSLIAAKAHRRKEIA